MIIYEIIWKQKFVDKLLMKHRVSIEEVEEVLANKPVIPYLSPPGTWIPQKGAIMKDNEHQVREPLPEAFASEDEAGEFWDTHSTADYEEYLEPVDAVIDIRRRRFEIEVDQETFYALNEYARKINIPVKSIASNILKENISSL